MTISHCFVDCQVTISIRFHPTVVVVPAPSATKAVSPPDLHLPARTLDALKELDFQLVDKLVSDRMVRIPPDRQLNHTDFVTVNASHSTRTVDILLFQLALLSGLGGGNTKNATKAVLERLMTIQVARLLNWKGRFGKDAFEHYRVKPIIIRKCNCKFTNCT